MAGAAEKVCVRCGHNEEMAVLEMCSVCARWYCPDCAHKAGFGRRFCSPECARAWYFTGDSDDDEDAPSDDDD